MRAACAVKTAISLTSLFPPADVLPRQDGHAALSPMTRTGCLTVPDRSRAGKPGTVPPLARSNLHAVVEARSGRQILSVKAFQGEGGLCVDAVPDGLPVFDLGIELLDVDGSYVVQRLRGIGHCNLRGILPAAFGF